MTSADLPHFRGVDFRLTLAPADFRWAGETRPGLPLLQWPDGTLCIPTTVFFGYSTEEARVSVASMKDEAYILREWLAFLLSRGVAWDSPNDALIREWRETHRERRARSTRAKRSVVASPARVERKISVVFEFYRLIPEAFEVRDDLSPYPKFKLKQKGGPAGDSDASSALVTKDKRIRRARWAGSERRSQKRVRRNTPSKTAVNEILERLRAPADRKRAASGPTRAAAGRLDHRRNWLIGGAAAYGGLRRAEIADLSIDDVLVALREEFTAHAQKFGTSWPTSPEGGCLDEIGRNEKFANAIVSELRKLKQNHRRAIYIVVNGKGPGDAPKRRSAPFAIDYVEDLLVWGIWGVRADQIAARKARDPSYVPPRNAFLSTKTGMALNEGSVGDILNDVFKELRIEGSGHRLRAFYGLELAQALLFERATSNGFRVDTFVRSWVLERVSEAMGHASSRDTVEYYVHLAELEFLTSRNDELRAAAMQLLDRAREHGPNIGKTTRRLLAKLIDLLARPGVNPEVESILSQLLADFGP